MKLNSILHWYLLKTTIAEFNLHTTKHLPILTVQFSTVIKFGIVQLKTHLIFIYHSENPSCPFANILCYLALKIFSAYINFYFLNIYMKVLYFCFLSLHLSKCFWDSYTLRQVSVLVSCLMLHSIQVIH